MKWHLGLAVALALLGGPVFADTAKKGGKEEATFGALKAPDAAEARKQAEDWLKSTGKMDAAKFKAIWDADSTLLEKVTATLVLGDADAAKLLAEARDPEAPAPVAVPAILKDPKRPAFYRH